MSKKRTQQSFDHLQRLIELARDTAMYPYGETGKASETIRKANTGLAYLAELLNIEITETQAEDTDDA